ncbi:MAG: DUF5069 domain-containing protein [Verrucomicrobia subdivision 3 bacterium]|nr:DUF5069 domain-containing protein [Limisphaerales bacterium]
MSTTSQKLTALNLTQRPPRSPRVRLGGYAMLPRVLDKARASLQGKAGNYKFGNPMDQQFFVFTGITQAAFLEQVKSGAGDWDILRWVNEQANPKRAPHEIRAWSAWLETMPIGDAEDFEWFTAQVKRLNPARTDLHTVMDYLDADDYASFGGKA